MSEHQSSRFTLIDPAPVVCHYEVSEADGAFIRAIANALGCSEEVALHGIIHEGRALASLDGPAVFQHDEVPA